MQTKWSSSFQAIQKRQPFPSGSLEIKKYLSFINPLIRHRCIKCSNERLMPRQPGSYRRVPGSRCTLKYLALMPQNVEDLEMGQLELFLRSLHMKYTRRFM